MNDLEDAFSSFMKADEAARVALLLEMIFTTGKMTYEEAKEIVGEDIEDVLVSGYGWRLLLPVKSSKAGD